MSSKVKSDIEMQISWRNYAHIFFQKSFVNSVDFSESLTPVLTLKKYEFIMQILNKHSRKFAQILNNCQ